MRIMKLAKLREWGMIFTHQNFCVKKEDVIFVRQNLCERDLGRNLCQINSFLPTEFSIRKNVLRTKSSSSRANVFANDTNAIFTIIYVDYLWCLLFKYIVITSRHLVITILSCFFATYYWISTQG